MKKRTLFLCAAIVVSLAIPAAAELTISTFAGSPGEKRQTDGPAAVASFHEPIGIASAGGGRFYVTDVYSMRRLAADGSLSTVAGGGYSSVDGIGARGAVDRAGYLAWHPSETVFFTTGCGIKRIDLATAHVTTYAGTCGSYTEGTGTSAKFFLVKGIAVAPDGTLYVADTGHNVIRKITTDRVTSLYAGNPRMGGHENGPRLSAAFHSPVDLTLDGNGNLYITEADNRRVRKITPGGEVSTLAGQGPCSPILDGTGAGACLGSLRGITTDPQGNVYVTDSAWNTPATTYLRRITPGGEVTTLGSVAEEVRGTISYVDGWVYMTAATRATVLRMNLAGTVETQAGRATPKQGLVNGPRALAQFAEPTGLDMDSGGNLFIADRLNHAVRKIDVFGNVSTFATGFNEPADVVIDSSDNVYVADRGDHVIYRITPVGSVSVLAGAAGQSGYVEGTGAAARFSAPGGLGVSGSTIYVADTNNQRIRKINSLGETSLVAQEVPGGPLLGVPQDVVPDGSGNLFVSAHNRVTKVDAAGNITFFASVVSPPTKIDIDPSGNLWLLERHSIVKLRPNGTKTSEAGAGFEEGLIDGTGSDARFFAPEGIAVTPRGIFVGDTLNSVIRHADAPILDRATIDFETGLVGRPRQLGTTHATASSYEWSITRRPSNSTATLSSTTSRTPTFTPDVPDLYVFRLIARNSTGVRVSEIPFWATYAAPVITSITPDVASIHHPTRVHVHGTNFSPSMTVRLDGEFGTVVPFTFVSSTELVIYAPPPAFTGWRSINVHVRDVYGQKDEENKAVFYTDGRVDGSTDFDFDGREELFWRNAVTGANRIWDLDPADPSRIARGAVLPDAPPEWTPAGFADFNGDRHADILWRNYHTGANVVWFLRDLQYIGGVVIDSAPAAMVVVGVGDVNGNGSPDIFWYDYRSGATTPSRIWLMQGTARVGEKILQTTMLEDNAAVRDFNGDGLVDVLLSPSSSSFQQPRIITNVFTTPTFVYLPEVPYDMRPAAVGDFDGDGDNDIFWRNRYTGETALWTMNGMAVAGGAYLPTISDMNMKVVGAAKIGTDARARVLWRNWTTGTNAQWTISGASVTGSFLEPVPQDWDLLPPR